MDFYAVLGVAPTATTDEIERAFRALARKVHPDRNGDDAERATARMKQLNEIRETLTDPLLRAGYDDRLRRDREAPGAGPARPPASARPPSPGRRPTPTTSAPPAAEPPRRGRFGEAYRPHPHVVPFLNTQPHGPGVIVEPPRRGPNPIVVAVVIALLGAAIALLWPFDEPATMTPPPGAATPTPPALRPEGLVVVRGPSGDLRRAIRKTARVVPVGSSFDDVVNKFGPPDRSEPGASARDLRLIYGEVRVELRDGMVVGGSP